LPNSLSLHLEPAEQWLAYRRARVRNVVEHVPWTLRMTHVQRELHRTPLSGTSSEVCDKCGGAVFGGPRLYTGAQCLCEVCLHVKVLKKFKQACSVNSMVHPGDNVMVALSGGAGSRAMLGMVREGQPFPRATAGFPRVAVVHLIDARHGKEQESGAAACCRKAAADCGYEYFEEPLMGESTTSAAVLETLRDESDCEDILRTQRRRRLLQVAHKHGFTKLMVGDTADALAARVLENLCKGRGAEIVAEGGYVDDRFASVQDVHGKPFGVALIRPMRDVLQAEAAADCDSRGFAFLGESSSSSSTEHCAELKDARGLGELSRTFLAQQYSVQGAMVPHSFLKMASRLEAHLFTLPLPIPPRPDGECSQRQLDEFSEACSSRIHLIGAEILCRLCDAAANIHTEHLSESFVCNACRRIAERAVASSKDSARKWMQESVSEFLL